MAAMMHLWRDVLRYAERLSPQDWFLVLGTMIVVALFCLRGFGSRSQY
jgi:hypothetical protein